MLAGAAIVAALPLVWVDATERSEVRVRDSNEATGVALDVETAPSATLRFDGRTWDADLGYGATFTARELDEAPALDVLHHARVGGSWHDRRLRVSAIEQLDYGRTTYGSLVAPSRAADDGASVEAQPEAVELAFVATRTTFVTRAQAAPLWSVTTSAGYSASGGADAASRAVLPLQSGPLFSVEVEHLASRLDRALVALEASRAVFSSGPEDTSFEATVAWRHRFEPALEGGVVAGPVLSAASDEGAPPRFTVRPLVGASLRREGHRLSFGGALRLSPIVDRLSGVVDERVEASGDVTWALVRRLSVRAELRAAHSVPFDESTALALAAGEAGLRWDASRRWQLGLGMRSAWQKQVDADGAPPQWVAFVAATFSAPPLRF